MHPLTKPLPPVKYLRECFTYNKRSGRLAWRSRPVSHFPNEWRWKWWNVRYAKQPAGRLHPSGYIIVNIAKSPYSAHRVIWALVTGVDPDVDEIDHEDRVRSNNRWRNLRLADHSQNMVHQPAKKNNRLGLKGVTQWRRKYRAMISLNGKRIHLGLFDTPQEAHQAYCNAAKAPHGVFFHP